MSKTESTNNSKAVGLLGVIAILYIFVTISIVLNAEEFNLRFFVSMFAYWGFLGLAVATIMTPFIKELYQKYGLKFLKIHHFFGISGLVFITLHPVLLAFEAASLTVFLPNFESWRLFWLLGGRPALILIYVSLVGVFLRKKFDQWRGIHALMYGALLLGYVHGAMIGTYFHTMTIGLTFTVLFLGVIVSFILKRKASIAAQKGKE